MRQPIYHNKSLFEKVASPKLSLRLLKDCKLLKKNGNSYITFPKKRQQHTKNPHSSNLNVIENKFISQKISRNCTNIILSKLNY